MQKKSIRKKHQNYDTAFKAEALRQVLLGRSVPEVARALEISEQLLRD
jgi:transposase-like protein